MHSKLHRLARSVVDHAEHTLARAGGIVPILAPIIAAAGLSAAQMPDVSALTPEQAARFERFEDFRINGVCGERDLERLSRFGVNTVRGYTIPSPEVMTERLDRVHELGMKMVLSEWMPHHGENTGNDGAKWNFDYDKSRDRMVARFIEKVEGIGDHPAILMWGLGNEVHLDEPYLRTVQQMSLAIHERFPHHLTSLTMINAKPEHIEAIKKWAPDIDVLGVQSYSPGAVRGAIRNTEEHWGRPFYFSEFNGKGPWNFQKTEWGEALDEPVPQKVADLHAAYEAIDKSPLSLGSTVFVWGYFNVNRATYFSLLLPEDPSQPARSIPVEELMMTPQAEYVLERFSGSPMPGNRAPVLTEIAFVGGERSREVGPGDRVAIAFEATDEDGDRTEFRSWVLDSKPNRPRVVSGPFVSRAGRSRFRAPAEVGDYLIMTYVVDNKGGASASTLPLAVRE